MTDEEFLKEMLASKVQDSTEIEHHLFEKCNLNCSFCGQDHDSEVGMDTIRSKAYKTIEFMKNSPLKKHTINVMGGEIFNDLIPEHIFGEYYLFYKIIKKYCDSHGLKFRINFVTNLIFHKNRDHVSDLLEATDPQEVMLSTSYDFAGRGLDLNRSMLFKANLERYKARVGVIGFVLTRPAIRKLIADKDQYFKKLYEEYPLYFDWYVPERTASKMMPSEQEMLDALLFVADRYPNIAPVKDLLENEHNKMTCFSLNKTTILPDGKEVKCRYLTYEKKDFLTEIDYSTNSGIIQSHVDRHDCLSCEYMARCQFRCFVQADWADLERLDTCMFKTFFDKTIRK